MAFEDASVPMRQRVISNNNTRATQPSKHSSCNQTVQTSQNTHAKHTYCFKRSAACSRQKRTETKHTSAASKLSTSAVLLNNSTICPGSKYIYAGSQPCCLGSAVPLVITPVSIPQTGPTSTGPQGHSASCVFICGSAGCMRAPSAATIGATNHHQGSIHGLRVMRYTSSHKAGVTRSNHFSSAGGYLSSRGGAYLAARGYTW